MLMSLGPIRFEVYPFNATDYEHGHESGFVEKPVLGARPPLEWVTASLMPHNVQTATPASAFSTEFGTSPV